MDDELLETLRSIVGEDTPDSTLRALLMRAGGDVASAANSFFDGGVATLGNGDSHQHSAGPPVGDDVLGTLFKTLEDQGRKLAGERPRLLARWRDEPGVRIASGRGVWRRPFLAHHQTCAWPTVACISPHMTH